MKIWVNSDHKETWVLLIALYKPQHLSNLYPQRITKLGKLQQAPLPLSNKINSSTTLLAHAVLVSLERVTLKYRLLRPVYYKIQS